jgi:hypothetical protein
MLSVEVGMLRERRRYERRYTFYVLWLTVRTMVRQVLWAGLGTCTSVVSARIGWTKSKPCCKAASFCSSNSPIVVLNRTDYVMPRKAVSSKGTLSCGAQVAEHIIICGEVHSDHPNFFIFRKMLR